MVAALALAFLAAARSALACLRVSKASSLEVCFGNLTTPYFGVMTKKNKAVSI